MTLTIQQSMIIIGIVAITTFITRVLPFVLFPGHKKTPDYIIYLGKVLPFAMIGMLIVYCLKEVSIFKPSYGLPEAIAIIVVILLHHWKKNNLISIGIGTVFYMVLVQIINV
ncbi:MAG: branched-chain amino acid transporter AzlD [Epulopiscium sp.]|nr:branched-chain amino acid transporter AzlD [Candidatus Epulonipiscium sp.]